MLPKWQKHLPHKLHSQPRLPMETTSYGEAWRALRKQNFGLCSTTYYSTVPITCTQTRIHRTQSLYYDKSLKRSSLRYIIPKNFAATIYRLPCEILLQRSLTRWFVVSMRCFADKSWEIRTKRFFRRLSFALLLHSIVGCGWQVTCIDFDISFRFTLANKLDEQYSLQDNNVGNFLYVSKTH